MATGRSRNRWWRFVPRSRFSGVVNLICWPIAVVLTVYSLFAHWYTTPFAIAVQTFIAVLAALNLVRVVTGMAELRR